MNRQLATNKTMTLLAGLFAIYAIGQMPAIGQDDVSLEQETMQNSATTNAPSSDRVTINVKGANIAEVLRAYSLQTGQNLVVGPDVVSENVNVRITNVPWQEALDVILKPYGFGYRVVGDTIVVGKLENMVTQEGIEPLVSKVFILKYLDAYDVKEICEAQLSTRGKLSILKNKGLPGWEFGGGSQSRGGGTSSQSNVGTMRREASSGVEKSKTLIITDVPSNVAQVEKVIEVLDAMPSQVLIESRFIEIGTDNLRDLGVDFATGVGGLNTAGVQPATSGNNQWGVDQNDSLGLTPSAFDPAAGSLSGSLPYNAGLQLLYSRIGGSNFEVMLHALEETGDANTLSAPRVLTQNNQEAAILVGQKYPIIESQNNTGGTGGGVTSTTLSYYENIGIQLNVIPQVCADDYINMIVHPIVSSIVGFEQGVVSIGGSSTEEDIPNSGLTQYPVLNVREAQTQIFLKSQDTVAIGGLQDEVSRESIYGVPFLKDIPLLGRLFRRETTKTEKIELLILIKASVVDNEAYAKHSQKLQQAKLDKIGKSFDQDNFEQEAVEEEELMSVAQPQEVVITPMDDVIVEEEMAAEAEVMAVEEDVADESMMEGSSSDSEEILEMVQ